MVLLHRLLGRGERALGGLHGEVRRQAAVLLAAVHGAAGEGEAHTHVGGGTDDGPGQVTGVHRVHVVVVHGGGDTAAGHHRQRAPGRGAHHLLVDPGPGRVERDEPVEEVVVGRETPGDPLVEVVVGVDETGRDQVPGGVDPPDDVLQALGSLVSTDGLDPVAATTRWPEAYSVSCASTVAIAAFSMTMRWAAEGAAMAVVPSFLWGGVGTAGP